MPACCIGSPGFKPQMENHKLSTFISKIPVGCRSEGILNWQSLVSVYAGQTKDPTQGVNVSHVGCGLLLYLLNDLINQPRERQELALELGAVLTIHATRNYIESDLVLIILWTFLSFNEGYTYMCVMCRTSYALTDHTYCHLSFSSDMSIIVWQFSSWKKDQT